MSAKQNVGHCAKNAVAQRNEIGARSKTQYANVTEEPLISVREASVKTGIPQGTIYDWLDRRLLPKYKFGKAVRLRLSDLWSYIGRQKMEALV